MGSKTCTVKIVTDGTIGRVYIDGVDVSKECCGYEIIHNAGNMPKIKLEFIPTKLEIENEVAVVERA